jgi:hypothetical protein
MDKQTTTLALSSTKAEYRMLFEASRNIAYL